MYKDIIELRRRYERDKGKCELLQQQLKETKLQKRKIDRSLRLNEKAQVVIQKVVRLTQEKLKHHLSDICSLAMASIFPDPYEVEVDFIPKRGKIETDIYYVRNGDRIHPFSSGGGAIDIGALSFRLSCWTLQSPKTRPIILLDEPLRFLSRAYQKKASQLIKEISDRLKIQIIMVSHSPELIESADNIIKIE